MGGERGGGRLISAGRTMRSASRAPPRWSFRRLNGDEGAIHGEIPMQASIPFRTALPRIFLAADRGEVSADCFEPLASGVTSIPGRGCGRLRDRFPGLSRRCRCFGHRVRASRSGILHRRLESRRGWPARVVRWARRFDSPAPPGGLTLRAPASPASKTPPIPRRFSMSSGGSGGGGRLVGDVALELVRWRSLFQSLQGFDFGGTCGFHSLCGLTALLHRGALKANSPAARARRGHGAPSLIGLREGCLHPGVRPCAAGSA